MRKIIIYSLILAVIAPFAYSLGPCCDGVCCNIGYYCESGVCYLNCVAGGGQKLEKDQMFKTPPSECLTCTCTNPNDCHWEEKSKQCYTCFRDGGNPITLPTIAEFRQTSDCVATSGACLSIGGVDSNDCCFGSRKDSVLGGPANLDQLLSTSKPTTCHYHVGEQYFYACTGEKCEIGTGWGCYDSSLDSNCQSCADCNLNHKCDTLAAPIGDGSVDSDGDGRLDVCDTSPGCPCTIKDSGDNCNAQVCKDDLCYCQTCDPDGDLVFGDGGNVDCDDKCDETPLPTCSGGVTGEGCPDCTHPNCKDDIYCKCKTCKDCGIKEIFVFGCGTDDCELCGSQVPETCWYDDSIPWPGKPCTACPAIGTGVCSLYLDENSCTNDVCNVAGAGSYTPCGTITPKCMWDTTALTCVVDRDIDTVPDSEDNCVCTSNPGQLDTDGDCERIKTDPSFWDSSLGYLQDPMCGDECEACDFEYDLNPPVNPGGQEIPNNCIDLVDNNCDSTGWADSVEKIGNREDCLDSKCTDMKVCLLPCVKGKDWRSDDGKQICDEGSIIKCQKDNFCDIRNVVDVRYLCNGTSWINIAECEAAQKCIAGQYLVIDPINGGMMCNVTLPPQTFTCRNGIHEPWEQCDPKAVPAVPNALKCTDFEYTGGVLGCRNNCTFDFAGCTGAAPSDCLDQNLDPGEVCRGNIVPVGITCGTFGLTGTLECTSCDFAGCVFLPTCAGAVPDGNIDPGEECDGNKLNDLTCQKLGFTGGTLKCKANCKLDTSGCNNCNNGKRDIHEECDGATLPVGLSCKDFEIPYGHLSCLDCQIQTAGCTSYNWSDPDSSRGLCRAVSTRLLGNCELQGQVGCWGSGVVPLSVYPTTATSQTPCCGDDGKKDTWLDGMFGAAAAACHEGVYCTDPSCSSLLCAKLPGYSPECHEQGQENCWSDYHKMCCIEGQTWTTYYTNQTIDKVLVPWTCINGKWYDRAQGKVTLYSIVAQQK